MSGPSEPISTLLRTSFFESAWDNEAKVWSGTEAELRAILGRPHKPAVPTDKRTMPAFSPAFYPEQGAIRGLQNAIGVGLLVLDVDNSRSEPTGQYYPDTKTGKPSNRPIMRKVRIDEPVTMAEMVAQLRCAGVAFIAWTTWSSTPDHEKFRVVVFLAHPVPVDLWPRAATWALAHLGLEQFRRGIDVPVLHNAAALAFLMGSPDPASIRLIEAPGAHLNIPLDELPPVPAPMLEKWQLEIVEERRADKKAGNYWWQRYEVDGRPVDFEKLDLLALLKAHGVKTGKPKPFKTGTKTRVWCPWGSEHSKHRDDDSAVVYQVPGTWPAFQCEHSGHKTLTLQDVIEWCWGRP